MFVKCINGKENVTNYGRSQVVTPPSKRDLIYKAPDLITSVPTIFISGFSVGPLAKLTLTGEGTGMSAT